MSQRKRPFGLMVIVLLQLLQLVGTGFQLVLIFNPELVLIFDPEMEVLTFELTQERPLILAEAIFSSLLILVSVIGVWGLRRWGWVLLMLSIGVELVIAIWQYFNGTPNYITLAISILTVFYLNQRNVQQLFLAPTSVS